MKQGSRLATIFGMMALVLISSAVALYWIGMVVVQSQRMVTHQRGVITSLNHAMSTLKDAETGQRGYLLTEDKDYLAPYQAAIAQIKPALDQLQQDAKNGDLSQEQVDAVTQLAGDKLDELRRTIDLHEAHRHDEAMELVRLGIGKATMESIRKHIDEMLAEEDASLTNLQTKAARLSWIATLLFVIIAGANLAFLYWAFRRVKGEVKAREAAALEVFRQKELLAVTLASIGDAVIVTDTSGRITFINKVAQDLTGWSGSEAVGRNCAGIFNIINEDTRKTVESPVDKVLRLGIIVGLANHTLLVRKDGSEIPIDDSGAPIRDSNGAIHGTVLVFRDFSEHKKNEESLRKAKSELETASKAKDHFLATLSHELRTPLTPVLATFTSWETSEELPEAFRDDVQMLRRNLALEARLIDDLLDLTRISRGKLTLEREVVDLHELLHNVAGMYRSEIDTKRISLSFKLAATHPFANVDPGRIQQVFWNILKNATKFTAGGGTIEIATADAPNGCTQITFHDTGIGMSKQVLENLFQPFMQGSEDIVRRAGGLGLGMAISKALVDIQEGTICAASEGSGKGSTFTLQLPAVSAPLQSSSPKRAEGQAPADRRLLKVLLVEDHADTARVMTRLLERLGHHVKTSHTVADALAMARQNEFDVLVSDIGLPDGTGLELIREIRRSNSMPAIALTGFGMDEDIAKSHDAGFNAHLTKPVNFQRLEIAIQQVARK